MALIAIAELRDDVQRLLQETPGSSAEFFNPEAVVRALTRSSNLICPMLPNGWFDGDPLINRVSEVSSTGLSLPGPDRQEGIWALPSDTNDLRAINLAKANGTARLFFDYGKFALEMSRMITQQTGLPDWIFIQQGQNLHFWPRSSGTLYVRLSYVKTVEAPNTYAGYMVLPGRAVPLIVLHAAAYGKLGELNPEFARALQDTFRQELADAMGLQQMKEARDPFLSRKAVGVAR